MSTKIIFSIAMLTVVALTACSETASSPPQQVAVKTPAQINATPSISTASFDALRLASGFSVGNPMGAHQMFVMFDPQCPHCGQLWASTKSLWASTKITWIPVGLMRAESSLQGAMLLTATNPADLMDKHEALLLSHKGGLVVTQVSADVLSTIAKNTELLKSMTTEGIPFIVSKHAKTGEIVTVVGALPPIELAAKFGWQ